MKSTLHVGMGATIVTLALLLAAFPGCFLLPGTSTGESQGEYVPIPYNAPLADNETSTDDAGGGAADGSDASGDSTETAEESSQSGGAIDGGASEADVADDDTPDDGDADDADDMQSGTLTAGTFSDHLNLEVYRDFVDEALQADLDGVLPDVSFVQRVVITVQDETGVPVGDARVVITPGEEDPQADGDQTLLDQPTGTDGEVLFLPGFDDNAGDDSFTVTVHPSDGSDPVVEVKDLNNLEWGFTLAGNVGALPQKLDLAFVIDTTGSMGDELEYLQAEVRDIVGAVGDVFPDVQARYGLILYRDVGDMYTRRLFDFTVSLDDFIDNLEAQTAAGGGNVPEAMHTGLAEAAELTWDPANTARVLFLIADAPPHTEHAQDTLDAVLALRALTIAIYPVTASTSAGINTELEFYMRAAAFLTGTEYIFLTDDSGVGNPHAEPHIPCYHVERLDTVMIRMIRTQLAGERIEPEEANIIRTVGNPVNGVCQDEPDDPTEQ